MTRILIVEDEEVIRMALRRLLERNGYEVCEAGSVPDAEENFSFEDFNLIVSDLRLPGPPGTDLISKAGNVPVLIMTSYASMRSAVDTMKSGAIDYIAKPFDHAEMIAAVNRIITHQEIANSEPNRYQNRPPAKRGETQMGGMIGNCPPMLKL